MPMTDSPCDATRGRLPGWMVILCVVMGISVMPTLVGLRCYRQHRSVRDIEAAGGSVHIQPGGPEWLRRLVGDKRMQVFDRVTSVTLSGPSATDAVLGHLPGLPHISSLDVEGNFFTDGPDHGPAHVTGAGLAYLKELPNLKELTFFYTEIPDADLAHLSGLANLESLALRTTSTTDAGVVHLAALTGINSLSVELTGISDASLVHLTRPPNLKRLFLGGTGVSDAGLVHLGGLKNLEMLDLTYTGITNAGLVHLHGLTKLKELGVTQTLVDGLGIANLRLALPNCRTVQYIGTGEK